MSANQNPFPKDYKYPVNGVFAANYRARGIRARLGSKEKWKPEEMLDIQKDVYSAFGKFIAQQLVKAWDAKPGNSAQLKDAIGVLRKWDGQMEMYEPAPMLIAVTLPLLQKSVAQHVLPNAVDDDEQAISFPAIERLFTQRPAGWFPSYDQILIDSLRQGIEQGEKFQGSKVEGWDYGQWMVTTIPNPVTGQIPLVGQFSNVGPVPMNGSSTSIKQVTRRLGPSMRMVVDLGNLDNSQSNIMIGESGHRLSRHYRDLWDAYYAGRSFPMQYKKVEAGDTLTVSPK